MDAMALVGYADETPIDAVVQAIALLEKNGAESELFGRFARTAMQMMRAKILALRVENPDCAPAELYLATTWVEMDTVFTTLKADKNVDMYLLLEGALKDVVMIAYGDPEKMRGEYSRICEEVKTQIRQASAMEMMDKIQQLDPGMAEAAIEAAKKMGKMIMSEGADTSRIDELMDTIKELHAVAHA